ncbi:TonB family protein [Flammeovirgaceae bacterium SG7u.111]|nr:TonB family protein [Flammeovirgaceae bacterium SG7u.132]WPO36916.1 TonB family protein [Flammeovirgaceae bacterium SG7u.111]
MDLILDELDSSLIIQEVCNLINQLNHFCIHYIMKTRLNFFLLPIFVLSLLKAAPATAQMISFFNKNWAPVYTFEEAEYVRKAVNKGSYFIVADHYKSGQIQMTGTFKSLKPEVKEGMFKWYNEEGILTTKVAYKDNKKIGVELEYYSTGELKSKFLYFGDSCKTIQIWTKEGVEVLSEGNGEFNYYDEELKGNVFSIYKDSVLVEGYIIRDHDQLKIYYKPEKNAEPEKGMINFLRKIGSNLKYPVEAKRYGVEGKVYVKLIIGKDGKISEATINRDIGSGCGEAVLETIEKIRKKAKWIPAEANGEVQNQVVTLPVNFKLG